VDLQALAIISLPQRHRDSRQRDLSHSTVFAANSGSNPPAPPTSGCAIANLRNDIFIHFKFTICSKQSNKLIDHLNFFWIYWEMRALNHYCMWESLARMHDSQVNGKRGFRCSRRQLWSCGQHFTQINQMQCINT